MTGIGRKTPVNQSRDSGWFDAESAIFGMGGSFSYEVVGPGGKSARSSEKSPFERDAI